jgi:hypothetical protein
MTHDWATDPRPISDCLKDLGRRINGGRARGSHDALAGMLGVPKTTYRGWITGRTVQHERMLRLAMIEIERRASCTPTQTPAHPDNPEADRP